MPHQGYLVNFECTFSQGSGYQTRVHGPFQGCKKSKKGRQIWKEEIFWREMQQKAKNKDFNIVFIHLEGRKIPFQTSFWVASQKCMRTPKPRYEIWWFAMGNFSIPCHLRHRFRQRRCSLVPRSLLLDRRPSPELQPRWLLQVLISATNFMRVFQKSKPAFALWKTVLLFGSVA